MVTTSWWALVGLTVAGQGAPLKGHPQCNHRGFFDPEWEECSCLDGFSGETCESCSEGFVGWPHCQLLLNLGKHNSTGDTTIQSSAYGWAQLCPEVQALRASMPVYLARLGELYEARQTISKSRSLRRRKNATGDVPFFTGSITGRCDFAGPGPWRLKVDFAPSTEAPAALRKTHRLVLVFDEKWPVALPKVRFVSKLQSTYALQSDETHVSEANSLLIRRLQEAAGGKEGCMWRQTSSCSDDGNNRESEKDRPCSDLIPTGASGYCDCNGDGEKSVGEPGYNCTGAPSMCSGVCLGKSDSGLPRHGLSNLLELLYRSLESPLDPGDKTSWQLAVKEFQESHSTAWKYKKRGYKHPALYRIGGVPDEQMIEPSLLAAIKDALEEPTHKAARKRLMGAGVITEVLTDLVFSFRVLTPAFCTLLMEEIRHFYASKLPARRPNSMNNYGIILNDIGLEPFIFTLQDSVIQPLAAILLPTEGSELESHHSFTIRYRGGEDTHLDVHTDDSDVTFNVNIFGNYTGAPLVFCGLVGAPDHRHFRTAYQHEVGYAVLHRGRHRHGAEDITSGERMNLVIWSYSYNYRSSSASEKRTKREKGPPDTRCVSYTHDRDFGQFRTWPPGKKERFQGRGWCPPRGKEYEGFVADVPDSRTQHQHQGQ